MPMPFNRRANFQEFTLSGTLVARASGFEETINLASGEGSDRPDGPAYKVVLYRTSLLRPELDLIEREIMYVIDHPAGDTLKVLRGMEGTTALAHNDSGGYKLAIVTTALDVDVSMPDVSPEDFGGKASAGFDNGPALQRAFDYSTKYGNEVRMRAGTYEISTQVDAFTNFGYGDDSSDNILDGRWSIKFKGAGIAATYLTDKVSGGPCLNFKRPSGHSAIHMVLEDFHIASGVAKPTHPMIRLEDITHECSEIVRVRMNLHPFLVKTGFELLDCFVLSFRSCYWDLTQGYVGIDAINDTLNGGELILDGCHFNNAKGCCVHVCGGQKFQRLYMPGTKFVGDGGFDRINITSLGTFTASSTSINIGTGHTLPATTSRVCLYIGNDDRGELVRVSAYDSVTGLATLEEGLVSDYSSDTSIECICGPFAFVADRFTSNIVLDCGQQEGTASVFSGAASSRVSDSQLTNANTGELGDNDVSLLYYMGNPCAGHSIERNEFKLPASSTQLARLIDSWAASAYAPTAFHFAHNLQLPNRAVIVAPYVADGGINVRRLKDENTEY